MTTEKKPGFLSRIIMAAPAAALPCSIAVPATAGTLPDPTLDQTPVVAVAGKPVPAQTIVLAGGCFWGIQNVFQHVKGVTNAVSGYAGGDASTAHYHDVGEGTTGHAEAVEVTYDPTRVTLGKILKVYFGVAHDPTELNRQGPDRGTQYRSTIFYANDEQKNIASAYIAQLNKAAVYSQTIATTLEPLKKFYPAEDYHQNYAKLNPDNPYIVINDAPKVRALKDTFPDLYVD